MRIIAPALAAALMTTGAMTTAALSQTAGGGGFTADFPECQHDSIVFCASQIPDPVQVRACLTANQPILSADCRPLIPPPDDSPQP
jgi:hypothetical protein